MTEPPSPDPPRRPVVDFGSAQVGDVRMGDAVGGDKVEHHYHGGARIPAPPAFQVPYPPNPLFRGRDAELAALAATLLGDASGTAAVLPAVSGTGGIGKTQLASEFAHRHRAAFPGGVLWLSMEQPASIAGQVAAAGGPGGLNLPGWDGLDFDGRIAAVRAAWREPVRRLLVFDNLEEPRLLQEWRPTGGGSRVLITTRRGVWARSSGVQAVPLPALARAESLRLLLAPRHGEQVEAALADPATAQEADAICAQVGDLPLALALAGAYLEQTPSLALAGYRTRLAESLLAHPSLDAALEEALPTQHAASVAATIALSYDRLDPAQAADALALRLLQAMAQLAPAPIPQRLLVRLAERDPDDEGQAAEADAPLRRLVALGLAELLPEGGAALHRLVAAFVRAYAPDAASDATHIRDALTNEIIIINEAGYPLRGQPYLPHLQEAVQRSTTLAGYDDAPLLNSFATLLRDQGDYTAARPLYERALAIREQAFGPNHSDTATSLHNVATLLHHQGDYTAARPLYEQALAIREQALGAAHLDTATSLNNLANLLQAQGNYTAARPLYEQALAIREQVFGSTHLDTARSLHNLATLLQAQGDRIAARLLYERAFTIFKQTLGPKHPAMAQSLNNFANLLQAQGNYTAARSLYEQALAIREQVLGPKHPNTATSLHNLATLLQAQGDYTAARPLYERALAICEQALGPQHPRTQAVQEHLAALDRAERDAEH